MIMSKEQIIQWLECELQNELLSNFDVTKDHFREYCYENNYECDDDVVHIFASYYDEVKGE